MVFGWGKKKEEDRPETQVPIEKEIRLGDISDIVGDLRKLRESQTVSEVKHIRDYTAPLIEELMDIGAVLEEDDLNVDDIDRHLAIIVVRGKKQVIDAIKKDVISLPDVQNIADATKLNSMLGQTLKKVGDVLGRQTRVIHIFAKKYAGRLKSNLEVMNSNHDEILELLKNHQSGRDLSDKILESVDEISQVKASRQKKATKAADTETEIKSTAERITSLEIKIKKAKSAEHYLEYLRLKKSVDDFVAEMPKIKGDIGAQFTKISRPLGRYMYGSSLDKEQKAILAQLVSDPFSALVPKNRDTISVILENVLKGIASGSISVKDRDKSIQHMAEVKESLDALISKASGCIERHRTLQDNVASYDLGDLNSLETDLKKTISLQADLNLRLETLEGEIKECLDTVPRLVQEIQTWLRNYASTMYVLVD